LEVRFAAVFTRADQKLVVPGFYDGEGKYGLRFSPPIEGRWEFTTRSNRPELDGKQGTLDAGPPAKRNHGPIRVFQTYYLRYADGAPYHEFGTTCYAWVHQTEQLQEQTLKTLATSPFNKIRFCVFPKSYTYNHNEPERFAFRRKADGTFDFDRPDPAFWRHFERRILDLQRLGIQADLILWHPYDRWGFSEMSDPRDDRYLRYCIARLAAFRNVWWSLANEYDFMTDQPPGHRGNKQFEDWDRFFQILQHEDPYGRMRGIHNGRIWYDHTRPWVTHASLQSSDMKGGVRYRQKYQKPVIYDECRYEGKIPQGWGNLTPQEMTQRFWLGTLSGCYVGHGETYKHPKDILWWSKGGVLHGQSPVRIQWLKDFMAHAPPFHELQPLGDDQGNFLLAKPGEFYLLYCIDSQPRTVDLAGKRPYKVDVIDPWKMRVEPFGTAAPGAYMVPNPKADLAYRFTPYRAGEKMRPDAVIHASATAGVPPLEVAFSTNIDGQATWNFGDGADALTGTRVRHAFATPGCYDVRLSVTDRDGARAVKYIQISVDRDVEQPIARAGFPTDETTPIRLEGTAQRTADGSIHLPAGPPWGYVETNTGVQDSLRGVRSFTIMGWLKPESLEIGSGGNRIVFCLNHDRSGIDLVCLADGRLRMSVNQWPDRVRNDSSSGKLKVGKWTFFAVTYDGAKKNSNVHWYFSRPLSAPDITEVRLDRTTTHAAGALAKDIGPLTIGNFNKTMRGYGFDRQFRGTIHGLWIFGSRLGGRGVLSLDKIQHMVQ